MARVQRVLRRKFWPYANEPAKELDGLKDAPTTINLLYEVQTILGAMPQGKCLTEAMHHARDQFELRLYKQFYADSGKAKLTIVESGGEELTRYVDDVPRKVLLRVQSSELNGAWIWKDIPHRVEHRKDYIGHNM